jgi:hypothetical protein
MLYVLGRTARVTGVTSFLGVPLIVMLAPVVFEVMCNLPTGRRAGIWGTEGRGLRSAQQIRSFDTLVSVLFFISMSPHEIAVGEVCKENYAKEKSVEVGLLGPMGI